MEDKKRWWGLAFILLAGYMDILDTTITNVAIPSIQHNLHMTYSAIQWVGAGYVLTYSLLLIAGGRLGDIFGRKRIICLGVAGFTIASLLSGSAPNATVLIAARLLQGAMAAVMVPQILATVQVTFPDTKERGKVMAMLGSLTGLAGIMGPLLGGFLIKWNLFGWDWRTIFLVNVPVGVICFVGALLTVQESKSPEKVKVDVPGLAMVSAALLLLVYPLVQGRELSWPLWTFVSMIASIPAFGLFLWYERRKNAAHASPLLVLSPFRKRSFAGGLIVMTTLGAGLSSFLFIFSLWLQSGLGWSAIHAGMTFLPFTLGIALTATIIGAAFSTKLGRGIVRTGSVLLIVSLAVMAYTIHRYGIATTSWELSPALLLYGAGYGFLFVSLFNFVIVGLKPEEAGSASGLVSTMQQLGGAMGIAVVGVAFFSSISGLANTSFADYAPQLQSNLMALHVPAPVAQHTVKGVQVCFHDRTSEKDPDLLPASCKQSVGQAVTINRVIATISDAGTKAHEKDFTSAFTRSLWVEISMFIIMFVSISLLPKSASMPKDTPIG